MKTAVLLSLCASLVACNATNVTSNPQAAAPSPKVDISGKWEFNFVDMPACFGCGGNDGTTSFTGTGTIQQSQSNITASMTFVTSEGVAQESCGSSWTGSATGTVGPCCTSNPDLCSSNQISCKAANGFNYSEQINLTISTGCTDIGHPLGTLTLTGGVLDVQGSPVTINSSSWSATEQ